MLRAIRALFATRRRRLAAGITVVTLVLVGCGGAVYASTRSDADRYRTAVAEHADVAQTLALTGQLAAAASRDVAFQVGGTVDSVLVQLGQTVAAGQQLATLDTAELDAAVTAAEDRLAQAQQQLEDDLEAQQNGGWSTGGGSSISGEAASPGMPSGGTSGSTPVTPSAPGGDTSTGAGEPEGGTPGGTGTGDAGSATDAAVTAAITAVTDAQQQLLAQYELTTQAQTASAQSLATAQGVCIPFLDASLVVEQPTTPDADADALAASNADELKQQLADCQRALADTQDAQQHTGVQQSALTDRAGELDAAVTGLQQALAAAESNTTASDAGKPSLTASPTAPASFSSGIASGAVVTASSDRSTVSRSVTSAQTAASGEQAPSASGSVGVTSETILADRAAIDAAEAALAVARRDRTLATLTSPISGTVVSVGLVSGDAVTAGSAEAAIRVQADDGYVVELPVSLAQIPDVAVGQSATVDLPAFDADYDAIVSSVGVENVSDTATPSYTVVVALDADGEQLRIGATARVVITLATAEDVLTVPVSAVTRDGPTESVIVLSDAGPKTVPVELGAVGSERIEITDGLSAGDRVVIADLARTVGDEDSTSSTGLGGLSGGGAARDGAGRPPEGSEPPSS